jgi:hypothetical protein
MADKPKRSHHKKSSTPKPEPKKIPRQKSLPGMENTKIAAIENVAFDYAEIRDQRQALTVQEVDLKSKLIDLMHKAGKTEYKRNGISVKLVPEAETVKVRVKEEDISPITAAEVEEPVEQEEPEPVEA